MKPLLFFILFYTLSSSFLMAQDKQFLNVDASSFEVDSENKLIVWNSKSRVFVDNIRFGDDQYLITEKTDSLTTSKAYKAELGKEEFKLYLTSLPILSINAKDSILNEPKTLAQLRYVDKDTIIHNYTGIELRGNSALKYPKKSYDLEIWEDAISKKSKDMKISGLRNDDDWILNSLYNEPVKIRSRFSNKLWLDMHKTRNNRELKGRAGIKARYVEVFINREYKGIYLLSEQVDRKLLKLKKIENGVVNGVLYKANGYAENTAFTGITPMNNNLPRWSGYEMEYPYENFEAHWEPIYELVDFVVNSDDQKFSTQISQQINIENAIDYFILVNLLRATDNLGKNYFIAKADRSTPFYFVPWDLDGVLGSIQDGKRISTTDDILSNGLFDRLLKENPNNYRSQLKERWNHLRGDLLSTSSLTAKLKHYYTQLDIDNIYERDLALWSPEADHVDDFKYMNHWLHDRVIFLDKYFELLE